jgi:hypothetical protein
MFASLIVAVVIMAPLALLFLRGDGWRKVLRILGIATTSFLAVVVSCILLLMWSCQPPSIEALQRRFPKQRTDLEAILAMSNEDSHMLRIDPTWLLNDTSGQFLQYDPKAGITLERWNDYRRLFSRDGISQGIQREPGSDDAFIIVDSEGLLNRGISNGYLFCGPRPVHRYAPCTSSASTGSHQFSGVGANDEGYSFIKLDGGWYAVSIGPS